MSRLCPSGDREALANLNALDLLTGRMNFEKKLAVPPGIKKSRQVDAHNE